MRSLAVALVLAATVLLVAPAPASTSQTPIPGTQIAQACCKVCSKGKACGDSCVAADRTCRQPPGCACDGGRR